MTEPGDDLRGDDLEGAVVEVEVGPIAHGGHCVARLPADAEAGDAEGRGRVVFVRHALPGERVRARITEVSRSYLRADAVEILVAAPDRVTPPCPYAGPDRCGGCDFQHVTLAGQRALKAAVVVEQLVRLGGLTPAEVDELGVLVTALPGGGLDWRTRLQYTVDSDDRAGLLKHRSHEVVPVDQCLIAHPAVRAAAVTARRWSGVDSVEVVAGAGGEVTVTARPGPVVHGPTAIRERAAGLEWTVPRDVFWQVHPAAADTLATAVVELLEPAPGERAWDLYGGVGLFAAALAPRLGEAGRVDVVESDARAVAAGRAALAGFAGVRFLKAPVERAFRPLGSTVDIVVLDPPRAGAGAAVVRALVDRAPRAVAYLACDPAALARDVRTFRDAGWRLRTLRAYDLFPMTHHIECLALLTPSSPRRS